MALRRHYYWHTLSKDVKKYVKTCQNCQEWKSYHRYKALLKPLAILNKFGQTLHIDHVGPIKAGPNGERYMFTVIDSYSNWVWIFPVQNTTSEKATQYLLNVVSDAGAFRYLILNNAASFTGKVMSQFCELFDINKIHISSYSAASSSRVKRFHGALFNTLKASVTNEKDWITMIPYIEYAFRSSPIRGIRLSPYEIKMAGCSKAMPIDMMGLKNFDQEHYFSLEYVVEMRSNIDLLNYIVQKNKLENQAVMKAAYDSKVTPYRFYQGQRCYLHDLVARGEIVINSRAAGVDCL